MYDVEMPGLWPYHDQGRIAEKMMKYDTVLHRHIGYKLYYKHKTLYR